MQHVSAAEGVVGKAWLDLSPADAAGLQIAPTSGISGIEGQKGCICLVAWELGGPRVGRTGQFLTPSPNWRKNI